MKRVVVTMAAALLGAPSALAGSGVVGTRHDFSATGPGAIHAVSEQNACVFCHVPHTGATNRPDPAPVHVPYQSTTMQARPGAPNGASRICLSCHDGTIAVGQTRNGRIATVGGTIPADSRANLGTDLRKTHPVSFQPAPGYRLPPAGDPVQLDRTGQVQCTSCHDPHEERRDPQLGKFLVKPAARSALCLSCHDATQVQATASAHATATAAFGARQGNAAGWSSVAEAGCFACHVDHGADPNGQLVERPRGDVDPVCLRCHDGGVARKSVAAALAKPYGHRGATAGVHDAGEGRPGARQSLPEASPGAPRHASCVDCHDPHAASDQPAIAPNVSGALARVWGIDQNGLRVEQVRYEYEVCFKCHGDSANKPQSNGPRAPETVRRQVTDANLRLVFAPTAASAHPVVARGRAVNAPSLKAPWNAGQLITCGDCHGADDAPAAGGTGVRGPHGSIYPHLLERDYRTAPGTAESAAAYALCYKCHDRDLVLSVKSPFPLHADADHLGATAGATCATCHDAHGVSAVAGTPTTNAHLVSFDVSVVRPYGTVLRYESGGVGTGNCTLTCHGHDHDRSSYSSLAPQGFSKLGGRRLRR